MLFKQAEFPWLIPKYGKRVRRLVSIMVMFLFSARSRQQYIEWSLLSFLDRIETLRTIVLWFEKMQTRTPLDPIQLSGIPLVFDLATSVHELSIRIQNKHRPALMAMVQNMYTVFSFFLSIFIRERFYMTDHTLSHTPHDPGTLFDNVVGV